VHYFPERDFRGVREISPVSVSRFTTKRVKTRIRLGKTWGRLLQSIEAKYL
jgi:hypothetical protein